MSDNKLQKYLNNSNKKQFINKSFNDFRADLLNYANQYYSEHIIDFSESSLGGLFLDFASIVGDSLVYYSEQQFKELDYETSTDFENLNKFLKRANIKRNQITPSSVYVTFLLELPVSSNNMINNLKPDISSIPVIQKGTILSSTNGIEFTLVEDIDFNTDTVIEEGDFDTSGNITTVFVSKKGLCVSGFNTTENVTFNNTSKGMFLSYQLTNSNVTSIQSVVDNENNEYLNVEYLTQSTVFKKNKINNDTYISTVPAIYKYIIEEDYALGKTLIRFGNGEGKTLKDNVLVNPEELILPLKNNDYFSRLDLDPSLLFESNTLGVSPINKTVTISYRYGGGISHNVSEKTIVNIQNLKIIFPYSTEYILDDTLKNNIINSISITNETKAKGGTDALSLNELKQLIPIAMKSQQRILTYEDLIARLMSMPTDFGRVHKAVALDNEHINGLKDLYIICKNSEGLYENASDALKQNISNYLNEFRLIGYNINILDIPIYNFGINIKIKIDQNSNIDFVLFDVSKKIYELMRFDSMQVGQHIDVNKICSIVENTKGVICVLSKKENIIKSKSTNDNYFDFNTNKNIVYNENIFNSFLQYKDGLVYAPRAGIFEIKYSTLDIKVSI